MSCPVQCTIRPSTANEKKTAATFDAYLTAGIAVQVAEQNILPVTAIANQPEVGQRSFWGTNLLLNLA